MKTIIQLFNPTYQMVVMNKSVLIHLHRRNLNDQFSFLLQTFENCFHLLDTALDNPPYLTFATHRSKPMLVKPAMPTPHQFKPLSDIDDQEALQLYNAGVIFYPKNHLMSGQDSVQIIKSALEKALVYHYPFAGRLHDAPGRKLVVECNGEGTVFVEADAAVRLEDFQQMHYAHPYCAMNICCVRLRLLSGMT